MQEEARAFGDSASTWVTRFLKSGGLEKLMALLEKVLAQLKEAKKEKKDVSVIIKQIIVLSITMRIVRIFVTTTVCSLKQDANADVFSIKQSASALIKRL